MSWISDNCCPNVFVFFTCLKTQNNCFSCYLEISNESSPDEHGLKIQKAAEKSGLDTLKFCDNISKTFRDLSKTLNLTNNDLSDILLKWRDVYKYDIDGIIVIHDEIYERENKNPEHAFAFKMII